MRTILIPVLALLASAACGCTVIGFDTPYNKGIDAYRAGNLPEAIEHFKVAIEKKPTFYEAWYNLALTYDELAQSRIRLAEAREAHPGDRGTGSTSSVPPAALREQAVKDTEKADATYQKCLEVNPKAAHALVSYAMFRLDQGDADAAQQLLERAVKAETDRAWVLTAQGAFFQQQGRRDEALAAYQGALVREPRDALTHYRLGTWHEDGNDLAAARSEYETATNLAPSDAMAWRRLGYLCAKQGEPLRGAASLETALSLDKGGEGTRADRIALLIDIAKWYQAAGYHERAVHALWRARDQAADDALTAPLLKASYAVLQHEEEVRESSSPARGTNSPRVPPVRDDATPPGNNSGG
ncbi:MAG: tetratricopeptide repeat protein [Planctomycetota bacterium]